MECGISLRWGGGGSQTESYGLDIVGLTSLQGMDSVVFGDTPQSQIECLTIEVLPDGQEGCSMRLTVSGSKTLTAVCACAPNSSLEYSVFLEKSGQVLKRVSPTDTIRLLGDLLMLGLIDTWWGMICKNGLLNLNPSSDFCTIHDNRQ